MLSPASSSCIPKSNCPRWSTRTCELLNLEYERRRRTLYFGFFRLSTFLVDSSTNAYEPGLWTRAWRLSKSTRFLFEPSLELEIACANPDQSHNTWNCSTAMLWSRARICDRSFPRFETARIEMTCSIQLSEAAKRSNDSDLDSNQLDSELHCTLWLHPHRLQHLQNALDLSARSYDAPARSENLSRDAHVLEVVSSFEGDWDGNFQLKSRQFTDRTGSELFFSSCFFSCDRSTHPAWCHCRSQEAQIFVASRLEMHETDISRRNPRESPCTQLVHDIWPIRVGYRLDTSKRHHEALHRRQIVPWWIDFLRFQERTRRYHFQEEDVWVRRRCFWSTPEQSYARAVFDSFPLWDSLRSWNPTLHWSCFEYESMWRSPSCPNPKAARNVPEYRLNLDTYNPHIQRVCILCGMRRLYVSTRGSPCLPSLSIPYTQKDSVANSQVHGVRFAFLKLLLCVLTPQGSSLQKQFVRRCRRRGFLVIVAINSRSIKFSSLFLVLSPLFLVLLLWGEDSALTMWQRTDFFRLPWACEALESVGFTCLHIGHDAISCRYNRPCLSRILYEALLLQFSHDNL